MLTIKRPTPTTVLYTVSTHGRNATLPARAIAIALIFVRVLAALFILTLSAIEYNNIVPLSSSWHSSFLFNFAANVPLLGNLCTTLSSTLPWYYCAIVHAGVSWLIFTKFYTEESLLVIRGLGVQSSTSSPSYLWTSSARFIPTSSIQDIFIHEAFKGFEVRYYLSIVVEGEEDVVVVFPVRANCICALAMCMH